MDDLSIIIVNWNTKAMLENCLMSIRQTTQRQAVKVIVVDNNSRDGSRDMVQTLFSEVLLINSGGNIGFARGNNVGISYADTPFVLFLNPDTVVMENAIHHMIDFMKANPSVGALGCKMKYPDGTMQNLGLQWFPSPFTELFNILFVSSETINRLRKVLPCKDPHTSGYVRILAGGCLVVRREVLQSVGAFDERFFMYSEDDDLCRRISEADWKLYYLSEAEIIHLIAGASGNSSNQFSTLMKCESVSKLMEKYYGKVGKLSYRFIIGTGSQARLLMLGTLKVLTLLRLVRIRKINFEVSSRKYLAMLRWSLGLERPVIKN